LWAIGDFAGHPDLPLAADFHRLQSLIPTLDHSAEPELRGLAHLVGVVEFLAILKSPDVVDSNRLSHPGAWAVANFFVVNLQAGSSCCFIHGVCRVATRDDVHHAGDHNDSSKNAHSDSHIPAARNLWRVGSGIRMRNSRTFSSYGFLSMSTFWHAGEPTF